MNMEESMLGTYGISQITTLGAALTSQFLGTMQRIFFNGLQDPNNKAKRAVNSMGYLRRPDRDTWGLRGDYRVSPEGMHEEVPKTF